MAIDSCDGNIIKSTEKTFRLLELLTEHQSLSITRLASLTGYSKSTTQRIINTLSQLKYVIQDQATSEYSASLKLHELGSRTAKRYAISMTAKPYLWHLFEATNETINLGIIENQQVIYIDKILTKHHLRADFAIGSVFPVHCSAIGKCIAAFNDSKLFDACQYEKYTPNSISDPLAFKKELDKVRAQGYAVDDQEFVDGLVCVAKPVLDQKNEAIAAIGISFPSNRVNITRIQETIDLLTETINGLRDDLYK